jgi:hypothetical protein
MIFLQGRLQERSDQEEACRYRGDGSTAPAAKRLGSTTGADERFGMRLQRPQLNPAFCGR